MDNSMSYNNCFYKEFASTFIIVQNVQEKNNTFPMRIWKHLDTHSDMDNRVTIAFTLKIFASNIIKKLSL